MNHTLLKHTNCEVIHCCICDGRLAVCTVCNGAEGSMPTHCPGAAMTMGLSGLLYGEVLDYVDGTWVYKGDAALDRYVAAIDAETETHRESRMRVADYMIGKGKFAIVVRRRAHDLVGCKGCDRGCPFCDGGLSACRVCHGIEGSLPTHCPGEKMSPALEGLVYRAGFDFVDGRWVHGSETAPMACYHNDLDSLIAYADQRAEQYRGDDGRFILASKLRDGKFAIAVRPAVTPVLAGSAV